MAETGPGASERHQNGGKGSDTKRGFSGPVDPCPGIHESFSFAEAQGRGSLLRDSASIAFGTRLDGWILFRNVT